MKTNGDVNCLVAVHGVDFSPNSTRLVSASDNGTATVWDIETGERAQVLDHKHPVIEAKYSPQGDRIATATPKSVRLYDSDNGAPLLDVELTAIAAYNNLLWFLSSLLAASDEKIVRIDASTGLPVSEWLVPNTKT